MSVVQIHTGHPSHGHSQPRLEPAVEQRGKKSATPSNYDNDLQAGVLYVIDNGLANIVPNSYSSVFQTGWGTNITKLGSRTTVQSAVSFSTGARRSLRPNPLRCTPYLRVLS